MNLFLVQHAEAKSKDEDPERSITIEGRRNVEAVVAVAARIGIQLAEIRHSGKTRAEETAVIFADQLKPDKGISATAGLNPLDDVKQVANQLTEEGESVMLVGHLPFMERLVGQLVASNHDLPVVKFRNGAVVCLSRHNGQWQVAWILTPEMAQK